MFDVIEVEIKAPHSVRLIAEGETESNANAIVQMAVIRRGVKDHFFTLTPAGQYRNGDTLTQKDPDT